MAGSQQEKENEKEKPSPGKRLGGAKKNRHDGKTQDKSEEKGMQESPVKE